MKNFEKISVKELVMSELGRSEKIELAGELTDQDFPDGIIPGEINGQVKLTRLDETILVYGRFSGGLEAQCARCLEKAKEQVEFAFEREYQIDRKAESEEDLYVDKYLDIDLTDPIREEFILAIPSQIVCSKECKGLCPKCGVNLNKNDCKCK